MAKVLTIHNNKKELQGYLFKCPGCKIYHAFYTVEQHPGAPVWTFNGDLDKPTFRASLLVNKDLSDPTSPRCHSFVTDGKIQFLGDCTHALKGQTVELPDFKNS